MSLLANNYLTLADIAKQTAPDGNIQDIIEMQSVSTALIQDAHVIICDHGDSQKVSIRSGLPAPTFRKIYGFTPVSKSETQQVTDVTAIIDDYSFADKDLIDGSSNPAKARFNESIAHIEGMGQSAQNYFIYGSKAEDPEGFDGLAVRYGKLSTDKKNIGYNIVDGGGTGSDNASIWMVTFGQNDTALLIPENSTAGTEHQDDGVVTETNSEGAKRKGYQDYYKQKIGCTVKDWRSTCRIANIDISLLEAGSVDLLALLRKGYFKINRFNKGAGKKTFLYCCPTIAEYLDKQAEAKITHFATKDYAGEDISYYRNIPVRVIEQLLETEARVV